MCGEGTKGRKNTFRTRKGSAGIEKTRGARRQVVSTSIAVVIYLRKLATAEGKEEESGWEWTGIGGGKGSWSSETFARDSSNVSA